MSVPATVVISDVQAPFERRKSLKNVIHFIGDYKPERVVQIGDLIDLPSPSRWNKDTRREFEQRIRSDSDYVKRNVLAPLRAVYDGPIGILEGNHDLRARKYLEDNAPALTEFAGDFHFKNLLDFDGFGIEHLPAFTSAGPDTVFVHGHEIKGMSQIAGTTAFNHAMKAGANVIMGHTHRLGIRRHTSGYIGGKPTMRWGFEVGHLMDPAKAQYLGDGGVANWQEGFGLLYVGKYDVSPVAIDIRRDGSFVVEGERYGVLKRGTNGKFAA